MRKSKLLTLIGSICLILVLATLPFMTACPAPPPTEKPIVLKMAGVTPAKHFRTAIRDAEFIKRIEEATGGRVKIEYYPSQSLAKPGECFDKVLAGVVDISLDNPSHNVGRFPLLEMVDVPGVTYNDANVESGVAEAIYNEFKPASLDKFKILWFEASGICGAVLTKKPVYSLSDLEGMTIRAVGGSANAMLLLGASPVHTSATEVYSSLQTGVIDGAYISLEAIKSFSLAEQIDYVTYLPWAYSVVSMQFMSRDKWDSLPKDIQQEIDQVCEEFGPWANDLVMEQQLNAIEYCKLGGVKFICLSPEETKKGLEIISPLAEEKVKELEDKGLPGREVLSCVLETAEKLNKIYPGLEPELK